jgi:xylulokinase
VGIDPARLPPLVPFGSVVGPVRGSVAAEMGISPEAVVVTGMPDLHAAALGSGGTSPYQAHLAISTTSWISCPVAAKKTDVLHSIATAPGLTNDSYLLIDNQETGGKALEWLRGALAGAGPAADYNDLTALAAASPPGANGVTFAPWLAGERSPADDKRVRAAFSSLSVTTSTADLVRAVLEGVAANSAWLLRYVERFTGRRLEPIRMLGGGALSTLWCQIYADTLDREVERVPQPMAAQLRGGALLAEVARGRLALDEVAARVPRGEVFTPQPGTAELYRSRRDDLPRLFRRERKWVRR